MKIFAAFILTILATTHVFAAQCLARRDMRVYVWASDTEVDFYADEVNAVMKTTTCHKPIIGNGSLAFQSADDDMYYVCAGDRVIVLLDGKPLFQCQILSIQPN